MNTIWHYLKRIAFYLYNFSGLRHIWENIIFPVDMQTGKWKPSTFILWITGIYIALFGIASQRYENRVDIIEYRISSIFSQLGSPLYKKALERIPETQNLPCPLKPDIKKPLTVYQSLFKDTLYTEGVDLLKATLENWKDSLSGVNLKYAILDSVQFSGANLNAAILNGANLRGATLFTADIRNGYLVNTDLRGATLESSFLDGAQFWIADMRGANMMFAHLKDADFKHVLVDSADFNTLELEKDLLSNSYYLRDIPINLPDGIDLPIQIGYLEWQDIRQVYLPFEQSF